MNKKATEIIIIFASFIMLSPIVVSASPEVMTHIDDGQDVLDEALEMVNRSNIDILQISAIKNGKEVELKLKLVEGGFIQKSTIANFYFYMIYLKTSNDNYDAFYTGLDLSGLSPEDLSGLSPEELEEAGALSFGVQDSQQKYIDVISCTGEGENELSIKFNVYNSNEKLIALSADVYEQSATAEFFDSCELTSLYPAIKSNYDSKVNTPLTFEATLEGGIASDYNWLWVFDDINIILEGQNPSYTFKIPDTYTGKLYVYDGDGSYGEDTFHVNVTGTSSNPDPSPNNEPGFELILVVAAVAIALILFRKKKK